MRFNSPLTSQTLRDRSQSTPSRRAGFVPLDVVASIQWREALRTAAFFLVAASTIACLILVLPVARYYDTVDYALGRFDVEVIGLLDADDRAAIGAIDGVTAVTAFLSIEPATLERGSTSVGPAKIYLTSTPDQIGLSWFADSTEVRTGTAGPTWLDVSADVARDLAVGPGDWIVLPFGTGQYHAQVRRVLAVARDSIPFVAVGPRTAEVERLLPVELRDVATVALIGLREGIDPELAAADIRRAIGTDRIEVRTRVAALATADADPFQSMPILVAITGLGAACLIGIAIREGSQLVARRRVDLAVIAALGVEPRRIAWSLSLLEAAFVVVALGIAFLVTATFAFERLFAAVLPPAFVAPLAMGLVVAAASYIGTLAVATGWRLRRTSLLTVLAAGRAR